MSAISGQIGLGPWLSWTPTISAAAGTVTAVGTVTARYKKVGRTVHFNVEINITTNGTGSSYLNFTLPIAKVAGSGRSVFIGQELLVTGKFIGGFCNANDNVVGLRAYDNTYPGADGAQIVVSGTYEI